jgi:hypothetical protein
VLAMGINSQIMARVSSYLTIHARLVELARSIPHVNNARPRLDPDEQPSGPALRELWPRPDRVVPVESSNSDNDAAKCREWDLLEREMASI